MQISSHSLSEFSSRGRQIEMANRLDSPHGVKVTNPHSHRRLHEPRLILITSHGSSFDRFTEDASARSLLSISLTT
jgi:hypothetical protein